MDEAQLEVRLKLLETMAPKVEAMHAKLLSVQWCPQPGLCLPLQEALRDHEQRMRRVEARIWQAVGAACPLTAIATVLIQHLIK